MNGIYHKIGIKADETSVRNALTTQKGLSGWWTTQVSGPFADGTSRPGESIRFDFGIATFDMKVVKQENRSVVWQCTSGPEDWVGSLIDFELSEAKSPAGEPMTLVYFRHKDWKAESEFTAHCSMKWAVFLLSLRSLVETGKGQPAPHDLKIDDMN